MRRLISTLGLATLAGSCTGTGHAQPPPQQLHGAAPFDKQIAKSDALLKGVDPAVGPPWGDPVIWKASIPEDNQPSTARPWR
jgi:hypothetical protein